MTVTRRALLAGLGGAFLAGGVVRRLAGQQQGQPQGQLPGEGETGMLRDPVSGCRFRPTSRSPEAYWVNGPYFFESDSTRERFIEDPKRFQVIRPM